MTDRTQITPIPGHTVGDVYPEGVKAPDINSPKTGVADGATMTPVPTPASRTMVRLTGFETGQPILVDPFDVTMVGHWNGTGPRTVIHVKDVEGATAVRETPTEVNNLLARAGVRVVGTDTDDRGIGYGTLRVGSRSFTMHENTDDVVKATVTSWDMCPICGHFRDECIAKGICPDPEPYTGAMPEDQG